MTNDDDNPYRFVEAVETEESAGPPVVATASIDGDWDLRAYVAPAEEPIYSPEEIAELGKRWSGFAVTTAVDTMILAVLFGLLLPTGPNVAPSFPATVIAAGFVTLAVIGLRFVLGREAYALLRALRYPPHVAGGAAAGYTLPVTNLLMLVSLAAEAVVLLRRHGIRAGIFGAKADDLPVRRDRPDFDA